MNNLLNKLKLQIDELENQVYQKNWNNNNNVLFDQQLFYTPKTIHNGSFYLDEIKHTYQILSDCILDDSALNNNNLPTVLEKITFFSELLINQITALRRELSTHHLRSQDAIKIYESLSEKHSRHLEYLRRLQEMKYELELEQDSLDYQKIAAIDNRIYRCEQAIKKIEKQMEDDSYS